MNPRVRNQVRLELVQVDIQSTIETERRCNRANHLSNQAVQVLERRARDVQVATANIIDSLIVNQKCAVGVLDRAVGAQDSVVRLDDSSGDSWSGVDGEFKLGFLAIIGGKTLKQEGAEA